MLDSASSFLEPEDRTSRTERTNTDLCRLLEQASEFIPERGAPEGLAYRALTAPRRTPLPWGWLSGAAVAMGAYWVWVLPSVPVFHSHPVAEIQPAPSISRMAAGPRIVDAEPLRSTQLVDPVNESDGVPGIGSTQRVFLRRPRERFQPRPSPAIRLVDSDEHAPMWEVQSVTQDVPGWLYQSDNSAEGVRAVPGFLSVPVSACEPSPEAEPEEPQSPSLELIPGVPEAKP